MFIKVNEIDSLFSSRFSEILLYEIHGPFFVSIKSAVMLPVNEAEHIWKLICISEVF